MLLSSALSIIYLRCFANNAIDDTLKNDLLYFTHSKALILKYMRGYSMLSKRDIEKELGKGIAIVPFNESNIKDNSINLTASKYAWGTFSGTFWYDNSLQSIYLDEKDIPENKRKYYKARTIKAGKSVVLSKEQKSVIILFPHSTTYIETLEVISTGDSIGGTCHSKVGIAAQGVGHIGTMMGPNYSGNCFVPLHNPTDKPITLSVGDTFMSVVFNHLDTPMRDHNVTTGGHTDKFSVLGIHATLEELSDVNADWKRSHETVCEKMSVDPHFIEFKKRLRTHRLKRLLSRKNVLFAIALIAALILLGVVASYIDKKSNTTIWSDRFWTVISAGVVVYFLQQITPKR